MDFYIARHGQTQWNTQGIYQGRLDSPLTSEGERQALQLGQTLLPENIEHIYVSPLGRARQTANICNAQLKSSLSVENDLAERSFGDWQGRVKSELANLKDFEASKRPLSTVAPPNGETALDSAKRFAQCLAQKAVSDSYDKVLVIAHGDVIKHFLYWINQDSSELQIPTLQNGSWCRVKYCHSGQRFIQGT